VNHRTITLSADLVERFELLAELLSNYLPTSGGNWALNVAVK
jgi:hypothetical protein